MILPEGCFQAVTNANVISFYSKKKKKRKRKKKKRTQTEEMSG